MNFSTGHQIVDAIGELHFSGNITHHSWWQHIRYSNKRGDFTDPWAVNILADIVYWYRPAEIRDEQTGHLLGYRKKFLEDKLQRSPEAFSELFGCSVKVVRESLKLLEELNLIDIELRAVRTDWGVIPTAMFIGLNSAKLKEITHSTSKPKTTEKSFLPKSVRRNAEMGKEPYPNGQSVMPKWAERDAEMGKSSIYIDFTETTQEISQETNTPLIPQGGNCVHQKTEILVETIEERTIAPQQTLLLDPPTPDKTNEAPQLDKRSRRVATKKNNNTRNEALESFLEVYRIEKPSNFTNHPKLSDKHVKVLSKLTAKFKERSLDVFTAALIWCREGDNPWWYKQRRSLDNLMSNGKIEEYADNHFDALEADPAYCDRVEGRAVSKDPKRNNGFQVFNEQGEEVTGASARAAAAVANDPLLALFLEQI